ncbi:Sec23/Sec24 trunk domain containing protein [Tritrichomonas foetus]|uniref:Sec23/Sec24 trunk domain containing protein n=1 Tax=Tritrichomonas foetus TaxID=1144522 RepID=A0A1J4J9M4_9EUKA|nr:Sec23/Sec24 trunk domain containing protein [Tritrichomonas foetus]|eukprot:OHS94927.1 Sec23/Sec24 trunk domain containing protein [Tritrichomonas foetus]
MFFSKNNMLCYFLSIRFSIVLLKIKMNKRRYVNPELQQASSVITAAPPQQQQQQQMMNPPMSSTIPIAQPPAAPTVNVVFPWGNSKLLNPVVPDGFTPLPPYFRATVNHFPTSKSVADSANVPLGIIVNPSQVVDVPVIDYREKKVPRCQRCNSYLSPYSQVVGDGNSWKCPFCNAVSQIDSYGYGASERTAEFVSPVYDIIAPAPFTTNPEAGPCFAFLIDLSYGAINSGFTQQVITSVKASLSSMDQTARVCLITMGSRLTVYDFSRKTEFVVSDITEPALPSCPVAPLQDCLSDFEEVLDNLLQHLGEYASNGHCYGSALLLAERVLGKTGGVLVATCVGIPTVGPYALKERHADKEITLIQLPEDGSGKFYREIGFRLNRVGVSVILFNQNLDNKSSDLSIISVPSGLTGGSCYRYPQFDPVSLHNDLFATMTSEYLWDSSMRLRCSTGVKISYIYSNCTLRENTVYYPVMSTHNAIMFELTVDSELNTPTVYFQAAVLWTNSQRQRMIRVFTFGLPSSNTPTTVKQSLDEAAIATILAKKAAIKVLQKGPEEASLETKRALTLISSGGFRFSSLYHLIHSLLCSPLLRRGVAGGADTRMHHVIQLRAVSLPNALLYMYPRFYAIDTKTGELPLENAAFCAGSVFLAHTLKRIYIWVSPSATPETLMNIFGVSSLDALPTSVPPLNNPDNQFVQETLQKCYIYSGKYIPSEVIPPGDPRESIFGDILVDVSTYCGTAVTPFISEMTSLH